MRICILDRACVYRNVFMPAYCKSRPYSIMLGLTCAVIFEGGILRKNIFLDFELFTDQELHDSVNIALGEVLHVGVERLPVGSVVVRACHSYSAVA